MSAIDDFEKVTGTFCPSKDNLQKFCQAVKEGKTPYLQELEEKCKKDFFEAFLAHIRDGSKINFVYILPWNVAIHGSLVQKLCSSIEQNVGPISVKRESNCFELGTKNGQKQIQPSHYSVRSLSREETNKFQATKNVQLLDEISFVVSASFWTIE